MNDLKSLIGQNLAGFQLIEMTEVFKIDMDGKRINSVGLFKNPDIAHAFSEPDLYSKTQKVLVLTNQVDYHLITSGEVVKIFNDESEALRLKNEALKKLSPSEKKLLGLT